MSSRVIDLPSARSQTYVFLEDARNTAHVYLWTDVDAGALKAARRRAGGKVSYVSYVVKAVADVIADYPDARAVLVPGDEPRLGIDDDVHAKILFDKTVDGQRCVMSGVVHGAADLSVLDIQNEIDVYKDAEVDAAGPFGPIVGMQALGVAKMRATYEQLMADPQRRAGLQGTFAVTSVGHEPVQGIFPMITGTLGFGIGTIAATPVVRDGQVVVADVFTLSLSFDHRVIDGALSSQILALVKARLENWETS